jgi:exosortase
MADSAPVAGKQARGEAVAPPAAGRCLSPWRLAGLGAGLLAVAVLGAPAWAGWVELALGDGFHSHLVLIPVAAGYLLVVERESLVWDLRSSWAIAAGLLAAGGAALGWSAGHPLGPVDRLAVELGVLVGCLWACGFAAFGWRWMNSARFPLLFMVFMIPLPDAAVAHLEGALVSGSAWAAEVHFRVAGVPVFRTGELLELPGITLRVADACSGLRSTWVLFITILIGHLLLRGRPGRFLVVLAVAPLGILRNAARILVIGWLCVNLGPEMIHSWIHRHGGPLFFGASLVPLLAIAWWLHRRDPANKNPPVPR